MRISPSGLIRIRGGMSERMRQVTAASFSRRHKGAIVNGRVTVSVATVSAT